MQHNDNVIELTLTQPSCVAPGAHAARKLFVSAAFLWSPHGMSYEYATSGAARQPGQAMGSRSEPSFRIAPSGATTSRSHETCQRGRRGGGTGACGTCKRMRASCLRGLAWRETCNWTCTLRQPLHCTAVYIRDCASATTTRRQNVVLGSVGTEQTKGCSKDQNRRNNNNNRPVGDCSHDRIVGTKQDVLIMEYPIPRVWHREQTGSYCCLSMPS